MTTLKLYSTSETIRFGGFDLEGGLEMIEVNIKDILDAYNESREDEE